MQRLVYLSSLTVMIKAVVSDFDGTLAIHHTVPPDVQKDLKLFCNSGIQFSIATGRAYEGVVAQVCSELNLSDLHIVRGGAEIYSRTKKGVVWGEYISYDDVQEVLKHLATIKDLYYVVEQGELLYSKTGEPHDEFGQGVSYGLLSNLPHAPTPKIFIPPFQNPSLVQPVYEAVKTKFPHLHIIRTSSSRGLGIDINAGMAGKHAALLAYTHLTGIDRAHILGVGDSYNDFPLLEACGIKVAMGNAGPELKAIADYVVRPVQDNGMIDVLNLVKKINNS